MSVEYPVNLPSESLNSAKVLCLGRCQKPLLNGIGPAVIPPCLIDWQKFAL